MIHETQLRQLLSDIESDRVERTSSTNNTDKFAEAICAFANDFARHQAPGYLLIGADDNGKPSGLEVTDALLLKLAAIRSDGNILPTPAVNVAKISLADGDIAIVEVHPADLPPVRYKGRVWIRVGPRKAIASLQEERMLAERCGAQARNFDASACPEAALSDIALGQFDTYRRASIDPDTIAENNRAVEHQMASLRLFDLQRECPTHAGILLFGKNPRYFLPGAYIQYLRLPGNDLTETPDDQAEISGDLTSVLRELENRIRVLITTRMQTKTQLTETLLPDYPEWALRELLMNAVMHRNYDSNTPIRFYVFNDRIEITSPGGLFGEANKDNFPRQNSYRNPIIAEALKSLGFVNRFGYGVTRAQTLLAQNGNPSAQFTLDDPYTFLVSIGKRPA